VVSVAVSECSVFGQLTFKYLCSSMVCSATKWQTLRK
jgi:hypothetical protein